MREQLNQTIDTRNYCLNCKHHSEGGVCDTEDYCSNPEIKELGDLTYDGVYGCFEFPSDRLCSNVREHYCCGDHFAPKTSWCRLVFNWIVNIFCKK